MQFRFLLDDVSIEVVEELPEVSPVLYNQMQAKANATQFSVNVKNVAEFYAENGNKIMIKLNGPAEAKAIELYLNGSALGAILVQRRIFTLHGSSFQINGDNIILCGDSGFGKSSITYDLVVNHGASFLTDDITPVKEGEIMPISDSLKIWKNTLEELKIPIPGKGEQVSTNWDKYFVKKEPDSTPVRPNIILFGIIGDVKTHHLEELEGARKIEYLLKNQYWEELVTKLPEVQPELLIEMSLLCDQCSMYLFTRPKNSTIHDSSAFILHKFETKK